MTNIEKLKKELDELANKKQAQISQYFFKTGPGEYGEGDVFLGIKVPVLRKVAKNYYNLDLNDLKKLLKNKVHEQRFIALVILTEKFKQENKISQKNIFKFYLYNAKQINNWDLVDISASKIVGNYLINKKRNILYELAKSKNLWEKRIAIVSTHAFIRQNDLDDSFSLSKKLLADKHDLIHKAVGWTLREVGKKNQIILEKFLQKNISIMPRTTLRYAIEKFDEKKRKKYLQMKNRLLAQTV